jgi:hypothetical protein
MAGGQGACGAATLRESRTPLDVQRTLSEAALSLLSQGGADAALPVYEQAGHLPVRDCGAVDWLLLVAARRP